MTATLDWNHADAATAAILNDSSSAPRADKMAGWLSTLLPQHDDELTVALLMDDRPSPVPATTDPASDAFAATPTEMPSPIRSLRRKESPITTFGRITGLLKWEGMVTNVSDGEFTAELTPMNHDGPIVEADFSFDRLPDSEHAEIHTGTNFYLAVREVAGLRGGKHFTSSIKLRRLGTWSQDTVDSIRERAAKAYRESLKYIE